jgi:hypothetical protein
MASNSFWSMRYQRGATFGRFPEQLFGLGVPLLSFDPFEMAVRTRVPITGAEFEFPAVPPSVWRLRYMSRASSEFNARHFCTRNVFSRARLQPRDQVLCKWGADPRKPTVIFPVSENRFKSILDSYRHYYLHLARLFSLPRFADVQFIVVSPGAIPGLRHAANVVHVPLVPFDEFLALVAASDLYLSDSLMSCMVNAFHLAVPVVLLVNSEASEPLAPGTFLHNRFFPYKLFPLGFSDVYEKLVARFEIEGCFREAEVLDTNDFQQTLEQMLFDADAYRAVRERCSAWKRARLSLPAPTAILDEILTYVCRKRS